MLVDLINEAKRQSEICNACRYCEGYCSVFPALHRDRSFDEASIVQLANLCHNCRGCYYACQYTAPHEFDLNLPHAFADVRQKSWEEFAYPAIFARIFHSSGVAVSFVLVLGFALLLWAVNMLGDIAASGDVVGGAGGGDNFYAVLSHNVMVAIFAPAFLLPLVSVAFGLSRYWAYVGGSRIRWTDVLSACRSAATMKNLAGGHGEGCNFEDEDRFSQRRRYLHQATLYGFLLCFASTSVATLMHYFLDMPAPYGPLSLPKLFGVSGGLLLCAGTIGLAGLKLKADRALGAEKVWGGEMAFVLLLFFVSATGLALYWLGATAWLTELLVIHLGAVFALFVLLPYSKMVHGFYRLLALIKEAQMKAP